MENEPKKKKKDLGQYLFDNHNDDGADEDFLNNVAPLIGNVVMAFNSLESLLDSQICSLFFDDNDFLGALVIEGLGYNAKVEKMNKYIIELAKHQGETPIREELVNDLKKAGRLRNAVVHAQWDSVDEEGYTYSKLKFSHGMMQEYILFTTEALKEIEEFILEVMEKFDDLETQLHD